MEPAFQFYVRDYLTDPQLSCASEAIRGVWIDLLCHMWLAPSRGVLEVTIDQLCVLGRCKKTIAKRFIFEAKTIKFCNILEAKDGTFLITSRRMVRDEEERANTRNRVKKHRHKRNKQGGGKRDGNAGCNENVTPPLHTASAYTPCSPPLPPLQNANTGTQSSPENQGKPNYRQPKDV